MPHDILLAAITGAQGLKGEVKAKLFTAAPDALPRYGVLHTKDGRKLKITAFRSTKEGEAVIAFEGIADRNQAEALKGSELFVERAALPEAGEDEDDEDTDHVE
jgi:16S rRNA processing protein RimM